MRIFLPPAALEETAEEPRATSTRWKNRVEAASLPLARGRVLVDHSNHWKISNHEKVPDIGKIFATKDRRERKVPTLGTISSNLWKQIGRKKAQNAKFQPLEIVPQASRLPFQTLETFLPSIGNRLAAKKRRTRKTSNPLVAPKPDGNSV